MAKHHQTTDDTEILVLLMYHWCSAMKDIMFATTKSLDKKKVNVEYLVRYLVNKQPLTPYLLLAHVWTGCNTTSAIQNQGKLKIFQELRSFQIQESVSCFGDVFATPDVVEKSGLEIFLKR